MAAFYMTFNIIYGLFYCHMFISVVTPHVMRVSKCMYYYVCMYCKSQYLTLYWSKAVLHHAIYQDCHVTTIFKVQFICALC